jgi:hypothetical protein
VKTLFVAAILAVSIQSNPLDGSARPLDERDIGATMASAAIYRREFTGAQGTYTVLVTAYFVRRAQVVSTIEIQSSTPDKATLLGLVAESGGRHWERIRYMRTYAIQGSCNGDWMVGFPTPGTAVGLTLPCTSYEASPREVENAMRVLSQAFDETVQAKYFEQTLTLPLALPNN